MFTVYVLYSKTNDKIYVGFISDLNSRFKSNDELATKGWTVRFRPWEILYTEIFQDKRQAMNREKQLKSHQGRNFIRELVLKLNPNS